MGPMAEARRSGCGQRRQACAWPRQRLLRQEDAPVPGRLHLRCPSRHLGGASPQPSNAAPCRHKLHQQGCAGLARGSAVRSMLALCPPACEGEFGVPAGGKGTVPGIGVRVPDVLRLGGQVWHNGIPPGMARPPRAAMRGSERHTSGMGYHGESSFRLLFVLRPCRTDSVCCCGSGEAGGAPHVGAGLLRLSYRPAIASV